MKTTVSKAIVGSDRTLVLSTGHVWRNGWVIPNETVITVGAPYERWTDVPFAWANGCPYWR